MTVILRNNAIGYLSTPISASDVGIALETGNGANFPALSTGEYFYATLVATNGESEIVKVTSRISDSLVVLRAQDGSTAYSFAAGSRVEMRVTAASIEDAVADSTITTLPASSITITDLADYYAATNVENALQEITSASKIQIVDAGNFYVSSNVESALQEITSASKINITDAGGLYTGTNVEDALQELGQAATISITDAGSYYAGTTVETALQEAAQAATIRITDPGNYYVSATVDGALQESAQATTIKITDSGSYYTGTTVEAALQEVGVSLAAVGPTPTASFVSITDAGSFYTGTTVEAALQEAAQASTTKIADAGSYYTATTVEGALQEVAASVASVGGNLIHAVGRIAAGATISGDSIGIASVASGGTGIYNITLTTAITDVNNIIPIVTVDFNTSTTLSYIGQCDVTSTNTIQVRTWVNETNIYGLPLPVNIGFCIVVYNTTP